MDRDPNEGILPEPDEFYSWHRKEMEDREYRVWRMFFITLVAVVSILVISAQACNYRSEKRLAEICGSTVTTVCSSGDKVSCHKAASQCLQFKE